MPNSLAPAFIKVEYQSQFGAHTMTLPTLGTNIDPSDPTLSTIDTWVGGTVLWTTMVNDLLALVDDFYGISTTFDVATLFTQESATADPIPRASVALAVVGDIPAPQWDKAVQFSITARTTNFGLAKLVMMDADSFDDWDKIVALAAAPAVQALFNEWADPTNGWSAQDNGRPATFLQATKTLNEKLRRSYRMT